MGRQQWNNRTSRELRNWLMFSVALVMTIVEGVAYRAERPFLLTLYATMMGLPLILQSQSREDDLGDDE